MKYKNDPFSSTPATGAGVPLVQTPSATGATVMSNIGQCAFVPWQPSTWPPAPKQFNQYFLDTLKTIFQQTMLDELRNVIQDIQTANAASSFPLEHRGHVVAVACMCALDAISSYGYKNRHVKKFVKHHFPDEYKPYANRIYPEYRLSLVHAWNLFGEAALLPGNEPIRERGGKLELGILNFVVALETAVADFLTKLSTDKTLQARALHRYKEVTGEVKAPKRNHTLVVGAVGFTVGIVTTLVVEALMRTTP